MLNTPLQKTFGFDAVDTPERRRRIRNLFEAVAPRYDLMNDAMSFGIHRLWKRAMVRRFPVEAGLVADLAGGTGDVARLLARKPRRKVFVCDASPGMMQQGRQRQKETTAANPVGWLAAEGEALPLPDNSLAAITIAFGLRNMTDPDSALRECVRCLEPGGFFLCLEFSTPHAWLRPFYNFYSFQVIPRLGAWIAGKPEAYQYLIESIRRFPAQEQVRSMLMEAGLADVHYRNLSFGIACLHWGHKPEKTA